MWSKLCSGLISEVLLYVSLETEPKGLHSEGELYARCFSGEILPYSDLKET